jgi:hypothetical protein
MAIEIYVLKFREEQVGTLLGKEQLNINTVHKLFEPAG